MRSLVRIIVALVLGLAVIAPASADVSEVRLARQPGLVYLPIMIIEQDHLFEKEAKKRGIDNLKVTFLVFNSGGAAVDALLSGNADLVTSGATNLLTAWSATKGTPNEVRGVAGNGALPMFLVSRNPNVKTIKDLTSADKIAVPTVRVSTQAIVMQMAAEKQWGAAETHKLDPYTVAMGHPDALLGLEAGKDLNGHFSLPPYQYEELKIPGVHVVLNSIDVTGGPASNGVTFSTTKFHDANPKIIAAFLAAMAQAEATIKNDKRHAAELYLKDTKEKLTVDDLVKIMSDPNFVYSTAPQQSMKFAEAMFRGGTIKNKPASWKDYFFPEVYNLKGS
ncbi:MAG: ABC transporter substrate-binding protein [Candidatus Eremiobacteraeota bacterium]|nr:ABC transporter substrate-binding protein [Candidatus Eremiobacteraeota bacterium]